MTIQNKSELQELITIGDVKSAVDFLKNNLGVSYSFLCKRADISIANYVRYRDGIIKNMSDDKQQRLLAVIEELFCNEVKQGVKHEA